MPEDAVKLKKQETAGTQSGDSHLVCAELGPGSGADGSRGTCAGKPPLPRSRPVRLFKQLTVDHSLSSRPQL